MQQTTECFVDYGSKALAEVALMPWYALYKRYIRISRCFVGL